jgi:hypothetical protein
LLPVQVHAQRDAHLSHWLWLAKWLLLIPRYPILLVLRIGFGVMTMVAWPS